MRSPNVLLAVAALAFLAYQWLRYQRGRDQAAPDPARQTMRLLFMALSLRVAAGALFTTLEMRYLDAPRLLFSYYLPFASLLLLLAAYAWLIGLGGLERPQWKALRQRLDQAAPENTGVLDSKKAERERAEREAAARRSSKPEYIYRKAPPPADGIPQALGDNIPKREAQDLIGREAALRQIRKTFLAGRQSIVLTGIEGIGKTALAEAYAGIYQGAYQHIAWIDLEGRDLHMGAATAWGLREKLGIDTAQGDAAQICRAIFRELARLAPGPCLLVLDEASPGIPAQLQALAPPSQWHVLLTAPQALGAMAEVHLEPLEAAQAKALYQSHCKQAQDPAALGSLLETVERHSLLVEILARTAQSQGLGLPALQKLLDRPAPPQAQASPKAGNSPLDRVRRQLDSLLDPRALPEEERWLLKQWACLPRHSPNAYQFHVLLDPEARRHAAKTADLSRRLAAKGWLQQRKDGLHRIHRLIAEGPLQRLEIDLDEVRPLLGKLGRQLRFDPAKAEIAPRYAWEPYGGAILQRMGQGPDIEIADLRQSWGILRLGLGDPATAKAAFEKALDSCQRQFEAGHPAIAAVRGQLGAACLDLGEWSAARSQLEQSLATFKDQYGEPGYHTARIYWQLGRLHRAQAAYGAARRCWKKAGKGYFQDLGPGHPYFKELNEALDALPPAED